MATSVTASRFVVLLTLPLLLAGAVDEDASLSAARKLQQIAEGAYPSGTVVEVSEDEMNSFLRYHAAPSIPDGVAEPSVRFRDGGAVLSAVVDLEKAAKSANNVPALMRLLLRGTRRVAVDFDYEVEDGYAATRLVTMAIEDVEVSGSILEWFVEAYAPPALRPYLLGEEAARQDGLREARLEPGKATLVVE